MQSCLLCRGSKIFAEHPDPAMRTLGPLNTRHWQCVCRPSCLILKSTPSTKAHLCQCMPVKPFTNYSALFVTTCVLCCDPASNMKAFLQQH